MAKEQKKPVALKRVRITGVIRKCHWKGVLFEGGSRFKVREFSIPETEDPPEHLRFEIIAEPKNDDPLA